MKLEGLVGLTKVTTFYVYGQKQRVLTTKDSGLHQENGKDFVRLMATSLAISENSFFKIDLRFPKL